MTMVVDLTCPGCNGARIIPGGVLCARCLGEGRRKPTLPEFDAVVAERNLLESAHREAVRSVLKLDGRRIMG